ncbi:head decoration protein [Rhodanobacter sp. OR92]|uniref:head decoration protein n=1 Tax=Rhodanobacter sp. OR92 TaxID=1076524 RepID=UPI0004074C60|nr:head decoration protein [Rhodanobacter sp. OR92]
MSSKTENPRAGDFLLSEANGTYSRENGILSSGNNLLAGAVVAALLTAVGTKISGTGDGAVGAVTLGSAAEVGTYVLTCTAAATGAGTFSVQTPSGEYLPNLTVAVAYATPHINLTVADGAADWAVGAVINVVVTAGEFTVLNPAGTDGSQIAAGVLWDNTNAADADAACVVIRRQAEARADGLVWPAAITEPQKSTAIAQLAELGIVLR